MGDSQGFERVPRGHRLTRYRRVAFRSSKHSPQAFSAAMWMRHGKFFTADFHEGKLECQELVSLVTF